MQIQQSNDRGKSFKDYHLKIEYLSPTEQKSPATEYNCNLVKNSQYKKNSVQKNREHGFEGEEVPSAEQCKSQHMEIHCKNQQQEEKSLLK